MELWRPEVLGLRIFRVSCQWARTSRKLQSTWPQVDQVDRIDRKSAKSSRVVKSSTSRWSRSSRSTKHPSQSIIVAFDSIDYGVYFPLQRGNVKFCYVGKSHARTGIGGPSKQQRVVLRRRKTVVGGKSCALPSARLVQVLVLSASNQTSSQRRGAIYGWGIKKSRDLRLISRSLYLSDDTR